MKTKRNLRCGIGILAALCFVASLFVPANAMAATQQNQVLSTNKWANEYSWNWASTVKSDLTELSDGRYERVEWVSDALYVEHYSDSYRFLDAAKITASTYTPTGATQVIWGGYFAGSQFNFVVTGQSNDNDSDSIVVMRVTKYSKNWNYLGNVEYSGINTYDPFSGGSLRMTEMNGELWIRTCHEMYKTSDGYHHQANMTFRIRESDLSKIDSETNVWNFDSSPMGYVSHSFNQFIVSTGSKIYSADHGDAYPRAIVTKDITPGGSKQAYYFINFKDQTGNNYTGSTLNGFETANNGASLIAAGTITDQNKAYSGGSSGAKNIWIGVAPTDGSQVSIKYLTNYEFDGNTTATDPALVKINENRFLALWSTTATNDSTHGPVQYVFIDGQGNTVSPVYNMNGALSDCQPIVAGDNVVWYTTGGSDNWWSSSEGAPTFYTINTSNGQSAAHDATQSHVVTFDSNGGSSVQSQNVRVGATATQPATPTRTGYTFQGWYTAKNGGTRYDFDKAVTGDITLYAHWTVNTYTLTFDGNGGNPAETTRTVQYGNQYGTLPTPTRTGYTFAGWYTAKNGGTKVTPTTTMGAANTTVYAYWTVNSYTLTFDGNGGRPTETSRTVQYGSQYSTLPTATRTGYTFQGWYTAKNGGSQVSPATTMGASDTTVYAHWAIKSYTVAFDSAGGSAVDAQKVQYGSKVVSPAAPTRTGHTFQGWYTARNGGSKYDFGQAVTGDITLYAHWTVNSYTLTFDGNGGKPTETSRTVAYGSPYGTMPTATRTGYTFEGWYTAKSGGSQVYMSTAMGASNATVYAHWTANTYTATFDSNGGSAVASQKVQYGSRISRPADPTRTGYTFQGWYTAKNGGTRYDFDKAVTGDVTLYARWAVITFRDVTSSTPHSADIAWIAEAGISTGWKEQDGSYTFRGMDTVKRQDMAAFLRRLAARDNITDAATWKPTEKDWNRFSDVNRNTPHAEDILWLAHAGISTGYPDGTFRGMVSVYRQDMAAFLHRLTLLAGKGSGAASQNFSDVTDATPHASDIRWLGGSGIAQGYPDGTFRGMTPVYRQDMAAFLHRLDTLVTR